MDRFGKYFLGFIALCTIVLLCWYFSAIIAYIMIAAVISFLGRPIISLLDKVKIKQHHLSNSLKSAITLVCLWTLFILFFSTIIPLVISEFQSLGNINISHIVDQLEGPINDIGNILKRYGLIGQEDDIASHITQSLSSWINLSQISLLFGSVANTITNLVVGLFSVTFITFFFLKDSHLFGNMVLAVLPSKYEESVEKALASIQKLLVRYFVGILIEIVGVMILNTLGLTIVGLGFAHAIVIGLFAGILNVIPYIGPIIGVIFGLTVGIVLNLDMEFYNEMLPLLVYMTIVMVVVQLIDNVFFQPLIYGNSVYAHPLEIFLVLLVAGSLAGIPGMILAIPGYTVIRVILKEFFNKYKLVKKITRSMEQEQ